MIKQSIFRFLILLTLSIFVVTAYPLWGQEKDENKEKSQWGLTGGVLGGEFKTDKINSWFEDWLNKYDVDIKGRTWNIGAARGKSGHSYFWVAYSETVVSSGSLYKSGQLEWTTNDVKARGFRVGRVWRFGPASWPVAPMFSLHGGVGKLSGQAIKASSQERKPIDQVFEKNWFPIAGASVGANIDVAKKLTISVSAIGLDIPGIYYGGFQVVYWP